MQSVNTLVVRALMHLRGVDEVSLANLVHVTRGDMSAWLNDEGEDSEDRIPFETQLEVLKFLGINGDGPRADVVHYWRIHESLFSRPSTTYWALATVLRAFGKAQAVYVAQDADPALSFKARSHFGLRFQGFYAMLEITAHPLRTISFDPDNMVDISWVPDAIGVMLPAKEYLQLEPGAMKVRGLQQHLTYSAEVRQWERLRDAAIAQGVHASAVANLMTTPGFEALVHTPSAAMATIAAAVPAAEPASSIAEPAPTPEAIAAAMAATQAVAKGAAPMDEDLDADLPAEPLVQEVAPRQAPRPAAAAPAKPAPAPTEPEREPLIVTQARKDLRQSAPVTTSDEDTVVAIGSRTAGKSQMQGQRPPPSFVFQRPVRRHR